MNLIQPKSLYCADCKGGHIEELDDGFGMSYAVIKELAEKYIALRTLVDSKHLFD